MSKQTVCFSDYINYVDLKAEISAEFYRTIFPQGSLAKEGEQTPGIYTGIIRVQTNGKKSLLYLHDDLKELPFFNSVDTAKMNCIGYAGAGGADNLARELRAFAIRMVLPSNCNRMSFFSYCSVMRTRHKQKHHPEPRICPTFAVLANDEVYFYYVLSEPLPMYFNQVKKIQTLQNFLSREVHKLFDGLDGENCSKPRPESIYSCAPVVGTLSEHGNLCTAYRLGESYTLDELNALVPKSARLHYYHPKLSLKEAEELYPNWYKRRIKQKRKSSGSQFWVNKTALYEWFIALAKNNISTVEPGVLESLAAYALKCQIDSLRLLGDLNALGQLLYARFPEETVDEHISNAIFLTDSRPSMLKRWSKRHIEELSGLTLPTRQRNGRTQKEHLALVHQKLSREKAVKQWQAKHPDGTKKECMKELDICRTTVNKWWQGRKRRIMEPSEGTPLADKQTGRTQKEHLELIHQKYSRAEDVKQWRVAHPTGTQKECMEELGICRTTVSKWWKAAVKEAKPEKTKHICPQCNEKMVAHKIGPWYWAEKGNYYSRTDYCCSKCGITVKGRAHIAT